MVNPKAGGKPFVQVYTDSSTAQWEEHVARTIKEQIRSVPVHDDQDVHLPAQGRVILELRFNLERPKSTPKDVLYPMKSRSDVDNLAKAVMDGMQKAMVFDNDCLVTDLSVQKRYADDLHPVGVEIDLTTIVNK